ncbi:MAG: 6,7-dimethyl-8-ribityllumazine synthase [Solirubrobacterales bacterium]
MGFALDEYKGDELNALASMRFGICVANFYEDLGDRLVAGAREGFKAIGVENSALLAVRIPGAFELPMAAKMIIESPHRDVSVNGVACLGVVIRGETDHYDFVCAEAARGIQDVQLATGVPCAFGVITCDTMEQALERTGGGKRDQGRNAALTVARMASMKNYFG